MHIDDPTTRHRRRSALRAVRAILAVPEAAPPGALEAWLRELRRLSVTEVRQSADVRRHVEK